MLHVWGPVGYGMFALASSLLVSLAILDCGIRSLTRLRLCDALKADDVASFRFAVAEGAAAFAPVALVAFVVAAAVGALHGWSHLLNLPPEGDFLIAATVGLVGIFMFSVLLLEPLAAQGSVSTLKQVNTIGALLAIPLVGLLVWRGGSVSQATFLYFVCLTSPNVFVLFGLYRKGLVHWSDFVRLRWKNILSTWRAGGWFYLTTISLIAKTHALTFVVSALLGPASAGTFYVLLRITEIVGGWGATASDTALASLANEAAPKKRAENFGWCYRYAMVFCLYGTIGLGFLTPMLLSRWLGQGTQVTPALAWAMALYGLSGALSKIVVNAAMGTGLVSQAAIGNSIEAALVLISGVVCQFYLGLTGIFVGATLAVVALFPTAAYLSRNLEESVYQTWLKPIVAQAAPLAICSLLLAIAWWSNLLVVAMVACVLVGGCALVMLKRLHH